MSDFIAALLIDIAKVPLAGWLFMLAVGMAHHEWVPPLPTIGFWWAYLLVLLIAITFAIYTKPDDS